MPTQPYKLADGSPAPGVTTVIANLGWNKPALMWWANQMGLQGKKHTDVSKAAADAGTIGHAMLEEHIFGRPFVPPVASAETLQLAEAAFHGALMWEEQTKVQIVATELCMVSEKYRFGGTLDAIGIIAGKLCLLDWKTSNGLYADYLIQIAAYRALWLETTGCEIEGGYHLCRFDKGGGGFTHRWIPTAMLEPAWRTFEDLLLIHARRKVLERLAK